MSPYFYKSDKIITVNIKYWSVISSLFSLLLSPESLTMILQLMAKALAAAWRPKARAVGSISSSDRMPFAFLLNS